MDQVEAAFNLPAAAVEDRLEDHQRPKLADHGDCVFVVINAVRHDQTTCQVDMGELDFFLGASYAITVTGSDSETIAGTRIRLDEHPSVRRHQPARTREGGVVFEATVAELGAEGPLVALA